MKQIPVVERILKANDAIASQNRHTFMNLGIVALNFMGAPGTGKTSLLERTLQEIQLDKYPGAIVEGDIATTNDAERLSEKGVPVVQINTDRFGNACHLDASMVASAIESIELERLRFLFIENIGNLVCPAGFDLGETRRIVMVSVTEGADKPTKYPVMFRSADVVLLGKIDLLPYTDVSLEKMTKNVRSIQPRAAVIPLSARTGEGLGSWIEWLNNELERC